MRPQDEVIDREIETKKLIEDIKSSKKFTINILCAPTAIGKSSITTKLSKILRTLDIESVIVRTNPINSTVLPEWTFVNCLFDELKSFYQCKSCSFECFINSNEYFMNLKAKSNLDILKDMNKDNYLFKPFLLQEAKNVCNVLDLLLENDNLYLYAKQEYINYIISENSTVLIIDNLQIIDDYSLNFLRRCFHFNSLKKQYVIFEYTESKDSRENVLKLSDYFKSDNIEVKYTHVNKIDSCYIADIIDHKIDSKPKDFQFNYDLIAHYVELNTGNIRELIDFSLNYSQPESMCDDKTLETVLRLNEIELFTLFVILEFDGCIDIEYLKKISNHANIKNIQYTLNELFIKRLVKYTDGKRVAIEHASITDALNINNAKLIVAKNTTISIIKSYIEELLATESTSIYPFLRVILNIYKEHSPLDILKLFQYIEASILVNLQPVEAWEYFSAFIDATIDDINNYTQLYITIFKLCFKFELYKEGFSCLEKTYSNFDLHQNSAIVIYRMLYLAALDKHNENISYFISMKDFLLGNDRLFLTANLAVLSSYRSLGDKKSCIKIHKDLKKYKYKKYIEYGYRNRLVDMYLSRANSIKYLKQSIKYFESICDFEQLAKSLITYTHILGGLGRIDAARRQITKAEMLLKGKILGKHMLLVNQAVLNLVDGNYGTDTYRLLDMAETSAIVPFDNLAIIVNKLVWCYENNRYDLVHSLTQKAENLLLLEPDKHVHSLLYYNLYINYKKEGDASKANDYLCKSKQTMAYCEPVRSRLLNKPTKETRFILGKPWHSCYLTYWTFDVLLD